MKLRADIEQQRSTITDEAVLERHNLHRYYESQLEAQRTVEVAQTTAATKALHAAEVVQKQLTERCAAIQNQVRT